MDKYFSEYEAKYKDCIYVPFDKLKNFMKDSLIAVGLDKDDAEIVSCVLIESDKRGIDSHGIGRLKPFYVDRIEQGIINAKTEYEIIKDTKACVTIDGHNSIGHVISQKAMQAAIDKAKEYGMGMAVVRNSNH